MNRKLKKLSDASGPLSLAPSARDSAGTTTAAPASAAVATAATAATATALTDTVSAAAHTDDVHARPQDSKSQVAGAADFVDPDIEAKLLELEKAVVRTQKAKGMSVSSCAHA